MITETSDRRVNYKRRRTFPLAQPKKCITRREPSKMWLLPESQCHFVKKFRKVRSFTTYVDDPRNSHWGRSMIPSEQSFLNEIQMIKRNWISYMIDITAVNIVTPRYMSTCTGAKIQESFTNLKISSKKIGNEWTIPTRALQGSPRCNPTRGQLLLATKGVLVGVQHLRTCCSAK